MFHVAVEEAGGFSAGRAPEFEMCEQGPPKMWHEGLPVSCGKKAMKRHCSSRSDDSPVEMGRFMKFLSVRLLRHGRTVM